MGAVTVTEVIQGGAKRTHVFSNNCNFVYFQYKKKYVNIKTTCNKCSFDYLHWLRNYGKLYRKEGVLFTVHASGASPQSSASHLLTFLVAQLQFLRECKLSDRRLYEVLERRLLIWGNPKERNRRQINLVSVGAKGHRRNARLRVAEIFVEQLVEALAVWTVAPFCWNHVSSMLIRKLRSCGRRKLRSIST